jgi:enoyl-CoA hydratase/carnithine racemase
MAYETILYEVANQVATITLNRPEKLNAYTATMGAELFSAFRSANEDSAVRAIILTGAGRAFCAGADIAGFADNIRSLEKTGHDARGANRELIPPFAELMRRLSKPVITALNGVAVGVGFTIPLLTDIRLAAEGATMGAIFARVGLISELGSTYLLPRMVGVSRAAEILLTGRRFTAAEMLNMGVLSYVTPADKLITKAREIADEILQCSPTSIAMTRRALYQGLDSTMESAMQFEGFAITRCYSSPEHKEYVTAFMEKRKPDFGRISS